MESFGQQVQSRSGESRTGEDALGPPEEGEVRSWGGLLGHGQAAREGIEGGTFFPRTQHTFVLGLGLKAEDKPRALSRRVL